MKYMTKEWYETCQKTAFHIGVIPDPRAAVFSDAYFEEVYALEEAKWLRDVQRTREMLRQQFAARGTPEASPALQTPYDPELLRQTFRELLQEKTDRLQKALPREILKQIADLRMLALHRATPQVLAGLEVFSRENQAWTEKRAQEDYPQALEADFPGEKPAFVNHFHFHDAVIRSCRSLPEGLILELESQIGMTDAERILFINPRVIAQEGDPEGAQILESEVWKTKNGYEFHFLLEKGSLMDYIIAAMDAALGLRDGAFLHTEPKED